MSVYFFHNVLAMYPPVFIGWLLCSRILGSPILRKHTFLTMSGFCILVFTGPTSKLHADLMTVHCQLFLINDIHISLIKSYGQISLVLLCNLFLQRIVMQPFPSPCRVSHTTSSIYYILLNFLRVLTLSYLCSVGLFLNTILMLY